MALTEIKTSGIADDAVTTDKLANAINTERTANTAKPSLANDANNRVVTGDGSGGLNGEANLTYDGSHLQLSNASQQTDSVGNFQIRYTGSESTYNSGLTTKSYSGTGQFMQWSTGGLRIGSRIITNSGIGNLYFTAGNDSVKAELGADGNLLINDGDLKIGTAGHGIDFSATGGPASGSGSSELLTDYEEGTYNPSIVIHGSGSITLKTAQDLLAYTKIGRMVHVHGRIDVDSVSSPSGDVYITLPFSTGSHGDLSGSGAAALFCWNPNGDGYPWVGWHDENTNRLYLREGKGDQPAQSASKVQANTEWRINLTYSI